VLYSLLEWKFQTEGLEVQVNYNLGEQMHRAHIRQIAPCYLCLQGILNIV
jgi:hypothetical protein